MNKNQYNFKCPVTASIKSAGPGPTAQTVKEPFSTLKYFKNLTQKYHLCPPLILYNESI